MGKAQLYANVEAQRGSMQDMAQKIWAYAETAHKEFKSSSLQKEYLASLGFTIKEVPNMPTAFIAECGEGHPIVGLLGEYDALPGLSQKVSLVQEAVVEGAPGHGCGHNNLGTGCVGAAVALKQTMEAEGLKGTVRYYGCPAEELLVGKPMMAAEGVFDDLDACLSWHPANHNEVVTFSSLAVKSIKFKFKGIAAHAAMAPHMGRSALDAVEIMNVGANYLREHVEDSIRLHYCITNGGAVPNSVPADAEVWYMVRAPKYEQVQSVVDRIIKCAEGAAHMTETTFTTELLSGCYDMVVNKDLSELFHQNLVEAGAPKFDEEDYAFAAELIKDIPDNVKAAVMGSYYVRPEQCAGKALMDDIQCNDNWSKCMPGSFDHGDVSQIVPFAYLFYATTPVGVAGHTWRVTAGAGHKMCTEGMVGAAKVMAGTVYDLLTEPAHLEKAKASFQKVKGDRVYVPAFKK